MACYHLGILLKKNLKILKRSYILTFFEIFSPVLVMLILWLTKSKFKTEHIPINIVPKIVPQQKHQEEHIVIIEVF